MVDGALAWFGESQDYQLDWEAWFTANLMVSAGKLKKGTTPEKLKSSLYMNLAEMADKSNEVDNKEAEIAKAEAEKERLLKRFNIKT